MGARRVGARGAAAVGGRLRAREGGEEQRDGRRERARGFVEAQAGGGGERWGLARAGEGEVSRGGQSSRLERSPFLSLFSMLHHRQDISELHARFRAFRPERRTVESPRDETSRLANGPITAEVVLPSKDHSSGGEAAPSLPPLDSVRLVDWPSPTARHCCAVSAPDVLAQRPPPGSVVELRVCGWRHLVTRRHHLSRPVEHGRVRRGLAGGHGVR